MTQTLGLGGIRLNLILDAHIRLDGNAVFYPATQDEWSPGLSPDAEGSISVVVNGLLISEGDEHTLVDTGFGEQERPERPQSVVKGLAQLGMQPTDISRVIITHAHGDHAMGNTIRRSGRWLPTFPSAEYVIQDKDLAAIREEGHAFWRTRFLPLVEQGLLRTTDGRTDLSDTLTCWPMPGHTIGHQGVLIRGGARQALAVGDLGVLAKNFEHPEWGPNWAWSHEADAQSRHEVCEWAVETGGILIVAHDPQHPWVTLERAGEGYQFIDVARDRSPI